MGGALWSGFAAGMGRKASERNKTLMDQEIKRREGLVEYYKGIYENVNMPPEIQQKAFQFMVEIPQIGFDKKLPKQYTDVNALLELRQGLQGPTSQPSAYIGDQAPKPTPEGLVGSAMGEAQQAGVPYQPPGDGFEAQPAGSLEYTDEERRRMMAEESEAATATELNRLQVLRRGGFVPQTHTKSMAPEPFTAPAGAYVGPRDPDTGELLEGEGFIVPGGGRGGSTAGSVSDFVNQNIQLKAAEKQQAGGGAPTQAEIFEWTKQGREEWMNSDPNLVAIRQLQLSTLQREGGAELTRLQFDQAAELQAQFTTDSANYIETKRLFDNVQAASRPATPAGDMAMIFSFMKILDPGSVVRESEFANAAQTGSIPTRVWTAYNRAVSGERLVPEVRQDFLDQAIKIMQGAQTTQDGIMGKYSRLASDQQIPPRFVIFDYSVGLPPDFSSGGAVTPPGLPEDEFDPLVTEP